jgi:Protein of unknown function (DUF3465)
MATNLRSSRFASRKAKNVLRRWPLTLALLVALGAAACSSSASDSGACNMSGFLATQHAHANRAEVTLCGTAERVRTIRVTRSGAHRAFDVNLGRANSIEVDANVDVMGRFPIHTGDTVTVRGEYYYDNGGREGVHWTHHATSGNHASGFIDVNGHRYQ